MPRSQPSLPTKTPSLNQKFLPQGSGGFITGKSSALLQGGGGSITTTTTPTPVSVPLKPVVQVVKNKDEIKKKAVSLLEEYFSVRILEEAKQCVEELNSPEYHSEFVKEAVSLALEKSPPCVESISKLLDYLYTKNVLVKSDLTKGCIGYGELLDDIAIDLPKAPSNFGEIMGHLVVTGGVDFKVVEEVLKKMEDEYFRKAVFGGVMKVVGSSSGNGILTAQADDVGACEKLF